MVSFVVFWKNRTQGAQTCHLPKKFIILQEIRNRLKRRQKLPLAGENAKPYKTEELSAVARSVYKKSANRR